MDYSEAMGFINSFSRLGKKVTDLSRIAKLLESLDNPQDKFRFIHIAGTNGKGSTLEYIADVLQNSGYKTGKFTSPYVTHYADRIRIDSEEIDEKSIAEICEFVSSRVTSKEFSQFEITMAIAMIYYLREKCDVVVLETGIGGLVDSTNIIKNPLVSVITSVSLDHMAILGNTVAEIAEQKAGIIKENCNCVLAADNYCDTINVVKRRAEQLNAPLMLINEDDIIVEKSDVLGNNFIYKGRKYSTAMGGQHQIYNAVTAIEVCEVLKSKGFSIKDDVLCSSLSQTAVQGRVQLIKGNPDIIVDGGHNISGVTALADVLKKYGKSRVFTALGMSESKDYVSSAQVIADVSQVVCCVDGFSDSCVEASQIAACINERCEVMCCDYFDGIKKIIGLAKENNGVAVVSGSLYLASAFINSKIV